jgi:hypothetical protein
MLIRGLKKVRPVPTYIRKNRKNLFLIDYQIFFNKFWSSFKKKIMKTRKKIILVLLVLLWVCNPDMYAQEENQERPVITEGSTLIYEVDYRGSSYLYIVKIISMSDKEVSYRFIFTSDGNQGLLSMNKNALNNATAMYNYYNSDEIRLEDKTSGWISKKVINTVKKGKSIEIDLGRNEIVAFSLNPAKASFNYKVVCDQEKYGKINTLPAISILDANKKYEFQVYEHLDCHVILKMDIGWIIRLVAII